MSGPQFFQTGMGRKFFESDMPKLVSALERIAEALESKAKEDNSYSESKMAAWEKEAGYFASVRWHEDDLIDAMKKNGIEPTEENIQKFIESRLPRTLEERSTEEGWEILDTLLSIEF